MKNNEVSVFATHRHIKVHKETIDGKIVKECFARKKNISTGTA